MVQTGYKRGGVNEHHFKNNSPGLYLEKEFGRPRRSEFLTGVPAFLGLAPGDLISGENANGGPFILRLSLWSQFERSFVRPWRDSYLAFAVRGFFQNGGQECYAVLLKENSFTDLSDGLEAIEALNTVDLVAAPDLVRDRDEMFEMQQAVVNHCQSMGDRFAILDSRLGDTSDQVWQQWSETDGTNGAIYYPWLQVTNLFDQKSQFVPPCGHIAGVYARTDQFPGVHKAPANEMLEGVLALERELKNADQNCLNPKGVNCLRAFSRARHPSLGRPNSERTRPVDVRQRPPAVSHSRPLDQLEPPGRLLSKPMVRSCGRGLRAGLPDISSTGFAQGR